MSSSNDSRTWPAFWSGVVSTLALVLGFGVLKLVHEWLASDPTVGDIVAWLTKPMFSVSDVATFLLSLLIVYLIVWMGAFGLRVSY